MPIKLTNATAVYAIMLVVFAAGMWTILAYGSTLRAPPDLAGEWELTAEGNDAAKVLRATIEQSGRFARLRISGRQPYELEMPRADVRAVGEMPGAPIRLAGNGASVVLEPQPTPDVYRVTIDSSDLKQQQQAFIARIIARAHPRGSSPRKANGNATRSSNTSASSKPSHAP